MKYSVQDPLWCKFCPTNRQEYVISEKDSLDYSLDGETSEVAVNSTQANETDLETSKSSTEIWIKSELGRKNGRGSSG